jgi:hypothetical protein
MNDIAEYMEVIVEPTFEDYKRNSRSVRHAYLACVAIYHAVDRAAFPADPIALAEQWRSESQAFMLVEEVAQTFKHGQRRWVKKAKAQEPNALLITHPLGLEGGLKGLELHSLYFLARDAVIFLRSKLTP